MNAHFESLKTKNLHLKLIDVDDAMESYWVAATKGKIGEIYNIGGNKTTTVGKFLELLKKNAKTKIISKVNKKLLRPTDVTLQIPDMSKFKKHTSWKPKVKFEHSVKKLLDHCRENV